MQIRNIIVLLGRCFDCAFGPPVQNQRSLNTLPRTSPGTLTAWMPRADDTTADGAHTPKLPSWKLSKLSQRLPINMGGCGNGRGRVLNSSVCAIVQTVHLCNCASRHCFCCGVGVTEFQHEWGDCHRAPLVPGGSPLVHFILSINHTLQGSLAVCS